MAAKTTETLKMDQICRSVITYADLIYGVEHSSSKKTNKSIVDQFVQHLSIIDWNKKAAKHYGSIKEFLHAKGNVIGAMDMMIAAR